MFYFFFLLDPGGKHYYRTHNPCKLIILVTFKPTIIRVSLSVRKEKIILLLVGSATRQ